MDEFIAANQVKINELRAQYGELAIVQSAWGPVCVFRKPTFHDMLKFVSEYEHSGSPVVKAWAPIKLLEQIILLPTKEEFAPLRERYGYEFADQLCGEARMQFLPDGKSIAKKL